MAEATYEEYLENAAVRYAASQGDQRALAKVQQMDRQLEEKRVTKEKPPNPAPAVQEKPRELSLNELWIRAKEDPGCLSKVTDLITHIKLQQQQDDDKNEKNKELSDQLQRAYEMVLEEHAMCYGYWIRLAKMYDGNWAKMQMIYKKGLEHTDANPLFWKSYLDQMIRHKEMSVSEIRAEMDEAVARCGRHWNSWDLWEGCIDFEEGLLKASANDVTNRQKAQLEHKAISRLRVLYNDPLKFPHKHLSDALERFKSAIGHGNAGSKSLALLNVTDLLLEDELEMFQDYVLENCKFDIDVTWQKLLDAIPDSQSEGIRVRLPDKTHRMVPPSMSLAKLRYLCGGLVDLLWNGRAVTDGLTVGELGEDGDIIVFDGSTLKKVLELASGRAVESWFVKLREEMMLRTMAKAAERAQYENLLRRGYYHPNPLDVGQISTWRKYLDFVESQGEAREMDLLYRRCVEACCGYPEFWDRFARWLCKQNRQDEAKVVYGIATNTFAKRRADVALLYADYLEQTTVEDAERTVVNLIRTGGAPSLLEPYLRLARISRRKDSKESGRWFEEAAKRVRGRFSLNRLSVETAEWLIRNGDPAAALEVLREEWTTRPSIGVLKYYISVMRLEVSNCHDDIMRLYNKAVANDKELSVADRWYIWKDLLHYVEHEGTMDTIKDVNQRYFMFTKTNETSLAAVKRKSADEKAKSGKKNKTTEFPPTTASAAHFPLPDMNVQGYFHPQYSLMMASQNKSQTMPIYSTPYVAAAKP